MIKDGFSEVMSGVFKVEDEIAIALEREETAKAARVEAKDTGDRIAHKIRVTMVRLELSREEATELVLSGGGVDV